MSYDRSFGGTSSDNTASTASRFWRETCRAEVEELVRRVVPDKAGNVDEMMAQFAGREDELVETLRTMEERSVAQRARAVVQRAARLEARARAKASEG